MHASSKAAQCSWFWSWRRAHNSQLGQGCSLDLVMNDLSGAADMTFLQVPGVSKGSDLSASMVSQNFLPTSHSTTWHALWAHTASSTQILLSELWFKFSYKYITASEHRSPCFWGISNQSMSVFSQVKFCITFQRHMIEAGLGIVMGIQQNNLAYLPAAQS